MKYELPQLPYGASALEPIISSDTINYHYGKHEQGYIDNLNSLIHNTEYDDMPLENIIRKSSGALFNNASQVWNHIFYFHSFSPFGGGEPVGALRLAIEDEFETINDFKRDFVQAGMKIFGSGWVWLSKNKEGYLFLTAGQNAENPLTDGLIPLLCFDVWEHAYYLDYKNMREEYLFKLWDVVDWKVIESRYIDC
ncbi:MAG: superoxide dismutase [Bacteroidales bacterium]